MYDKGVYDLSRVQFIGQINIEGDGITLDFGDNYINMNEKSINSLEHGVTIKYKNDKYGDLFSKRVWDTIIKEK